MESATDFDKTFLSYIVEPCRTLKNAALKFLNLFPNDCLQIKF